MLLSLMLWIPAVFGQKNMKEKLFALSVQSSTSYVRIFPDHKGPFREATVCMRFHSSLTREFAWFSLSIETNIGSFLLYCLESGNHFYQVVSHEYHHYNLLGSDFTEWTSICVTWNPVWGLFIDGKYYKVDKISNVEISGDPNIIIGQNQQLYGGGFRASLSFVGEMTDLNMWDKALTDENMMDYFADNVMSGNVINWNALNYTLHGDVTIKPYVDPYPCVQVEF